MHCHTEIDVLSRSPLVVQTLVDHDCHKTSEFVISTEYLRTLMRPFGHCPGLVLRRDIVECEHKSLLGDTRWRRSAGLRVAATGYLQFRPQNMGFVTGIAITVTGSTPPLPLAHLHPSRCPDPLHGAAHSPAPRRTH